MEVWVAYFTSYDTHYLVGVYDTKAQADAAAKEINAKKEYGGYCSVVNTRMELNEVSILDKCSVASSNLSHSSYLLWMWLEEATFGCVSD